MKKLIYIFGLLFFYNCIGDTIINDCFENVSLSGTINLSLPEFNSLQVTGTDVTTRLGARDILIIKRGTSTYKVYDLECPEKDCTSKMTFDDGLKIVCPCSGKEYNSLNGSPIDGDGCFALEYNVVQSSSSTLQISR